jgi:hypothetical protein
MKKFSLALAAALAATAAAVAQAQPNEAARQAQRLQIRATITQKMAEAAQLEPAVAQRMAEIITRYDDLIAGHQRDNHAAFQELRRALETPQPDVGLLARLNDRITNNRTAVLRAEMDRTAELRRLLNPLQYARASVAYVMVTREIRRNIHRAIQDRVQQEFDGNEE